MVVHFARSSKATDALAQWQISTNTVQHKLIQDVSTRWNSTYEMLKRLEEQKIPLTHVFIEQPDKSLSNDEWLVVSDLIQLLALPAMGTTCLCSESNPTLSYVYPMFRSFINRLPKVKVSSEIAIQVQNELTADFTKRWSGPPHFTQYLSTQSITC